MLLAIDVGNSNVVIGLFDATVLAHHWRFGTSHESTSDDWAARLLPLFALGGVGPGAVDSAIVSCVVPPLLPIFERMCTKHFGSRPLVVGPGMRTGMPIRVDNPREVGADRIVNAVAAAELLGTPVISIDFGTATSFDCVSEAGEFVGGALVPGVRVSLDSLVERAAKLQGVEVVRPPRVLGRNTVHMLQSGVVFGYAGLVDRLVERLREELGAGARVVATGGLAHLIASETKTIERVEPFLTLEGLRLLDERNREEPAGAE